MITYDKMGGRTVELFLPFEHKGKKVKAITFSPIRFDHTLRWQNGEWKSVLGLMAAVADVDEEALRNVAYPDTDRMMDAFVGMLPSEIRDTLGTNQTASMPPPPPQPEPVMTNGGTDPMAPSFQMDTPDQPADPTGLGVDLNG